MIQPDLKELFNEYNEKYFNNEIPDIPVVWNTRLRTTSGRAHYNGRKGKIFPTKIDLNKRLFASQNWNRANLKRTLIHEMVHAWMQECFNEVGHNDTFHDKMYEILGRSDNCRLHDYDVSSLQEKRCVEMHCEVHGMIGSRARMPPKNKSYVHVNCGAEIKFKRKQTVSTGISLN